MNRRHLLIGALALAGGGFGAQYFFGTLKLDDGIAKIVTEVFGQDILPRSELERFAFDFSQHLRRTDVATRGVRLTCILYSRLHVLLEGADALSGRIGFGVFQSDLTLLKRSVVTAFIQSTNYATRTTSQPVEYIDYTETSREAGCSNLLARYDNED